MEETKKSLYVEFYFGVYLLNTKIVHAWEHLQFAT